jgi:hypothetical protein
VFQVGDFGFFPSVDRIDPPTRKHAERHGYSLESIVRDFQDVVTGKYQIPIPTYFIAGNHEDNELLMVFEKQQMLLTPDKYLKEPIKIVDNLFYVPDGCIFKLGNSTVAGWGKCWGAKTWEMGYWSEQRAVKNKDGYAKRLSHMTRDIFERLVWESFDVLVTHDAPTGTGVKGGELPSDPTLVDPEMLTEGQESGLGVPYIRELIDTVQPYLQVGGHWHERRDNIFGNTRAVVLDKIYPGQDAFKAMEFVVL